MSWNVILMASLPFPLSTLVHVHDFIICPRAQVEVTLSTALEPDNEVLRDLRSKQDELKMLTAQIQSTMTSKLLQIREEAKVGIERRFVLLYSVDTLSQATWHCSTRSICRVLGSSTAKFLRKVYLREP